MDRESQSKRFILESLAALFTDAMLLRQPIGRIALDAASVAHREGLSGWQTRINTRWPRRFRDINVTTATSIGPGRLAVKLTV